MATAKILTPLQVQLMDYLFADEWFRRHFYLTGGTALSAYYLQHRFSEDLDFFSHGVELISIPQLVDSFGKQKNLGVQHVQTSPGFQRYLIAGELKVDVVADVGWRVGAPELIGNFMVDCEKNIAVNKVGCILGRFDAKDYIDLYYLLTEKKYDIFELIELGQNKDGGLEPFIWSSLIAEVERLTVLPRMIRDIDLNILKKFYLELRDRILDQIKPK